jgi:signal transduction histidine kinase
LLSLADTVDGGNIKLKLVSSKSVVDNALVQIAKAHKVDMSHIRTDIDDMKIYGNLESLSQILYIFLDNAIKYSPSGKDITLNGKSENKFYKFTVIDQGKGIAKADMPLIFERLYRGDKNRSSKIPGHGLGLALAKEIAKANQAGLSVSNNPSKGATFSLIVTHLYT